jgi:hypothetical protein
VHHNRLSPKYQALFILLNECMELLQKDILRMKCARDTKSVRKWTVVLHCAMACKEAVQAIENNELDRIETNVHACRIACKKCIDYCYTSVLFSNSYIAADKILSQLQLYSSKS